MIRIGQKLRLPRDEQLLVDPLYVAAASELQRLQSGLIASERLSHKVRSGESLSVIAKRYKVSVRDLQNWNNISNPHKLRVGQTLTLFHSPAPSAPVGVQLRSTFPLGFVERRRVHKLDGELLILPRADVAGTVPHAATLQSGGSAASSRVLGTAP